jgi:hypothetical protein
MTEEDKIPITHVGNGKEERSRFAERFPFSTRNLFTNSPTLSDNEVLIFIIDRRLLEHDGVDVFRSCHIEAAYINKTGCV